MKKLLFFLAIFISQTLMAQNVGIGLINPTAKLSISANGTELAGSAASTTFKTLAGILGSTAGSELSLANFGFSSTNNSSLGIRAYRSITGTDWMSTSLLIEHDVDNSTRVNSTFIALGAFGNIGIGTTSPFSPLTFNNNLGQKISLYGNATNNYGIGVQAGTFQIHSDAVVADIAFGYGSSGSFTETMRIKGNGNAGIGTTQPASRLHIADMNLLDTARSTIIMSRYFASGADTRASAIYHYYKSIPGNDQLVFGVSGDGGVNTSPVLYSNAKMLIQANGNVGIGINIPLEKLEINGNCKASNFVYSAPKTFYYNISGTDFRATRSTDTTILNLGDGSIGMENAISGKRILAPVHLPNGATMIGMTVYIMDYSVSDNLSSFFYRKTILDNIFASPLGIVTSSGSSGVVTPYQTTLNSGIVDNSLYTYYISIGTEASNGVWVVNMMLVRAVVIEYTLSSTQ